MARIEKKRSELNVRVGKRIRARRDQLGWTAQHVATRAELSQSFISKLEKGDAGFSPESLTKVAGALAVSLDSLLAGNGNLEPAMAGYRSVPVLDYIQAGRWTVVNPSIAENDVRETVLVDLECPPSTFAMRIRGDSMEPEFVEGDLVIVDPTRQPKPGNYVVAQDENGEGIFKKYRVAGINEHGKQVFELFPLNPNHPTMRSDRQAIAIVGVVIEHHRHLVK